MQVEVSSLAMGVMEDLTVHDFFQKGMGDILIYLRFHAHGDSAETPEEVWAICKDEEVLTQLKKAATKAGLTYSEVTAGGGYPGLEFSDTTNAFMVRGKLRKFGL